MSKVQEVLIFSIKTTYLNTHAFGSISNINFQLIKIYIMNVLYNYIYFTNNYTSLRASPGTTVL